MPGPKSKKGQMSALESMFTAKLSSSKPEKGKSEKPQDTIDARREEVSPKLLISYELTIVKEICVYNC